MAAIKAPDAPTPTNPTDQPVLVEFYDVAEAAVLLKLRAPDDLSNKGEKWLRDGYNRPSDGSKGRQNARPRPSTGRPRRTRKTAVLATV
jgi:hypothetical protein